MPAHEFKICPQCNQQFECKVGSITLCQCMQIKLPPAARQALNKYDDCLCHACLTKTAEEFKDHPFEK